MTPHARLVTTVAHAQKGGDAAQFDQVVRNTYKVLLTRGMLGATVFYTDAEAQVLLESLMPA